jgi:DNA helicase HerA-like ATPase
MSVITIKPVESGHSKSVIGIAGQSGDGKTYTALLIARGMVSKPSEIGFLDTENKRGSLYADVLEAPFMIGDLYPPFSPSRYATAIKQFQDAGVKVLVIDSVTHEWEGDGGCDDIANAPKQDGTPRKIANWIEAKREHKKFMNVLLQSNMDIICCIRAREKTDFKDPTKPVSLGVQPICEKNFMFELTASIMMSNQGKNQKHLKVPQFLKDAFGSGNDYLGIETGKKIRAWLDKGKKEDPEIARFKSEALLTAESGTEKLKELWESVPKELKSALKDHFALCIESAKAYESQSNDENEFDKLEKVTELFELKKELLGVGDLNHIENVIQNKVVAEYDKVIYQLNKLKNEK